MCFRELLHCKSNHSLKWEIPQFSSITTDLPALFSSISEFFPESNYGHWDGDVTNAAWKGIELPEEDSAWKESVEFRPFYLSLLWEVLEKAQRAHG